MNMRSALQKNPGLANILAGVSIALAMSTAAVAVPLDNQPSHPYDKLTLAQPKRQQNALAAYRAPDNKPVFVHGPTNVSMGYITVQAGDGCSGFARTQSFVHGPTNVSMGYVAVQSGNDCIISGSTDPTEFALLPVNDIKPLKPRKSIASAFSPRSSGATSGNEGTPGDTTGGGSSSTGGGPGGGGGNPGGGTPPGGGGVSPVPLPATLPLLAFGIAGLVAAARRKKTSSV